MSSSTAASLPLSGQDGGSGWGGPRDFSTWQASNRVHMRSLSSSNRFTCSRNSATCLVCSSCLASISWHQRRNWSSGGRSVGLLDMTMTSMVRWDVRERQRLRRSGDHLGAGVPKLLRIASEISCSAVPMDGANCSLRNSQSQWIIGASPITSQLQPAKQTRRRRWCSIIPPMTKLSFFGRLASEL